MSGLDYDAVTPFREMLREVARKRELRAIQRTAFEVGGGLAGVDHCMVWTYVRGEMHPSRLAALSSRLEYDPEFREYAELRIEAMRVLETLTPAEREQDREDWREIFGSMPLSPRDRSSFVMPTPTLRRWELSRCHREGFRSALGKVGSNLSRTGAFDNSLTGAAPEGDKASQRPASVAVTWTAA